MLSDEDIEATLATCSLRLKHVLLLMRYTGADEPYVARNCRVRIAKQLEDKKLVTTKPEGRMNWLVCVPTPEGERALEILADRLRVRLRDQSVTERAKAGLV